LHFASVSDASQGLVVTFNFLFYCRVSNIYDSRSSSSNVMSKKQWTVIALVVVLGGLSFYLNKDWFSRDNIQIYHRSRPARASLLARGRGNRSTDNADIDPITFGFDRKVKLTELKVIPVSAIETNKYPQPIWHLISESNSIPIKDFFYGTPIQGMHPAIKGAAPDPLEPGVKYRLIADVGPLKLEHDFTPVPRTP